MTDGLPLNVPVDTAVALLGAEARDKRLAICGGAGLSIAAGLPSGPELARRLHGRFARFAGYHCATPDSLLAVADAAAALPDGLALVQRVVLDLAPFSRATPQLAHRLLALLLAEDALRLLLTNWDDCVERSTRDFEPVPSACNAAEAEARRGQFVIKIHGCCTQANTLLITSEQLEEAPIWTRVYFGAEIGRSTMAFVGIGDVADYARQRITELAEMVEHARIRVVSPDIQTSWDASVWKELLPDLPEARQIARTADDFLDQLARDWVTGVIVEFREADDAPWIDAVAEAFSHFTAVQALVWLRRAAMRWSLGESVVRAPGAVSALEAIALSAREPGSAVLKTIRFIPASAVLIDDQRFEVLICRDRLTPTELEELASERSQRVAQSLGPRNELRMLVAASSVRGQKPRRILAIDVLDPDAPVDDVVSGPRQVSARLTYVDDLLEAA